MTTMTGAPCLKDFFCFAFLSVLLVITGGCAINPVTGQQEWMFLSESQGIQPGTELYPNVLWGGEPLPGDPDAVRTQKMKMVPGSRFYVLKLRNKDLQFFFFGTWNLEPGTIFSGL